MKILASTIAVATILTLPVYVTAAHGVGAAASVKPAPSAGVVMRRSGVLWFEDRSVGIGSASRKAMQTPYIDDWLEGYPMDHPYIGK
jgi:hypothetical protein